MNVCVLFFAGLSDAEVVTAHELNVSGVVSNGVLEGEWYLLGIDGEYGYSIVEQFLIKLVILEFLPPDEALYSLLEDVFPEGLIVFEAMGELRVTQDGKIEIVDLLELVAIVLLLHLWKHNYDLLAGLRFG